MTKTRYQQLIEQQLERPIEEFLLDYLRRGENRSRVSRRTGIPVRTLREWESRYIEKRRTYRVRAAV